MRKRWLGGLVAIGVVLGSEPPAGALTAQDVMGFVGKQQLLGPTLTILNTLGVFSMLGIGSDAEIDSKLNEIISQLNAIESQIGALSTDLNTSTQSLLDQTIASQIGTALPSMSSAQARILRCVDELSQLAAQTHDDANDATMLSHALEIVGGATTISDCSYVRQDFDTIHSQIVSTSLLSGITSGIYTLIARVSRANSVPFENIAAHFVQYELVQRQAVDLLRSAYLALGEPATMQLQLQQAPNYLGQLHDEEIAFLSATDTYVADNPTMPHDTSPAMLADAIMQGFEGDPQQATTYSLSILDNEQPLTPVLTPPGTGSPVAMSDTITGVQGTYYAFPDLALNTDLPNCDLMSSGPGFSYVRPVNGPQGGFEIGFGCGLHVERHLNNALPNGVDGTWTVTGRNGVSAALGPATIRNAVTSNAETAADALALAADPNAAKSPFALLSIVADTTDPTNVVLTVDLPGQTGAAIGAGTTHGFVAGSSSPLSFHRVPQGPRDPDAYAFETAAGTFLAIGADGYATLAATATYFDISRTGDGHVLITTADGQVLYVDYPYQQFFYGEAPDDVWGNQTNLIGNTATVAQWTYPADGIPRVAAVATSDPTQLYYYPPCIDDTGAAQFAGSRYASPTDSSEDTYMAVCSAGITNLSSSIVPTRTTTPLNYVTYDVPIINQDSIAHAFQISVTGAAIGPDPSVVNGTTYAGIHCYVPNASSPLDHFDTPSVATQPLQTTSTGTAGPFTVPVTANSSVVIQCQTLDDSRPTAQLVITDIEVQPCRSDASQPCVTFQ